MTQIREQIHDGPLRGRVQEEMADVLQPWRNRHDPDSLTRKTRPNPTSGSRCTPKDLPLVRRPRGRQAELVRREMP
jgi:hypothetical protein